MPKPIFQIPVIITLLLSIGCSDNSGSIANITPNQFKGSDIERIQSAVNAAKGTTNLVVIPSRNSNRTNVWLIDSAILLPGNMTVILDNCTIQLSDSCRDNMFRSDNVGTGISDPQWNYNIRIIGVGDVTLKGASNPRATGDSGKKLGERTYGSDADKSGRKQTGDWRNIMILMAYVDGFKLNNVCIENSHAWAVSFERTKNADISDVRFNNPSKINVNGKDVVTLNKDGIDLRHGCKNFRINNISGNTSDDFIALSILGLDSQNQSNGNLNSTMVTTTKWNGPQDDTEQIFISNITCQSYTRAIAIRANDSASIKNVYINGVTWNGHHNVILLGGKGYGKPALPGNINNIHAMNIMGNGSSLVLVEEAVASCSIINGIYTGEGEEMIRYNVANGKPENIITGNLIKIP
jgi:hypothetical protein